MKLNLKYYISKLIDFYRRN